VSSLAEGAKDGAQLVADADPRKTSGKALEMATA
jgi:hypothetical protein